ncbi:MAG: glutamate racemase [Acidobacteriota bacterium]|nr:glutamate racemase [Acidobacteriota bacterium]MDH3785671.1 glutamate racemase [Acidobacteriota bacterium]
MDSRPIGVFDSGVGGLTVFRALEQAVPGQSLVYLGDTARVPYGTKSAETVRRYATEAGHFMRDHDVKLMVVACNTASAVALEILSEQLSRPVMGVIEAGARQAAASTRNGRIGVIGTRATIGSGAYSRVLAKLNDAEVVAAACPLFVPLAEEGWVDDDIAEAVARRYLAPIQEADVDTLVLGCTHYPLLKTVIRRVMGEGVTLVDSAEAVATQVAEQTTAATAEPIREFYVTDVPAPFKTVAERFLGREIEALHQTRIEGE